MLGLIPAREGSKRIPDKNIVLCGGRPLLSYTCEAALASRRLTRVVITTDSKKISKIAIAMGVEAPFLRPASISRDSTPMIDVVRHAYKALEPDMGEIDGIVLLQPTSPLRTTKHIDQAIEVFMAEGPDSVVSVVRPPHIFRPDKLISLNNGELLPYSEIVSVERRFSIGENIYARNGPAVLVMKPSVLEGESLYGKRSLPYEMPMEESVDIDTKFDLAFAEFLINRRLR